MYFYEDQTFFSASVNNLSLKPLYSQYSVMLGYKRTRKGTGSNYQRVSDSNKKTKSALWRTMPQI